MFSHQSDVTSFYVFIFLNHDGTHLDSSHLSAVVFHTMILKIVSAIQYPEVKFGLIP